MARASIVALAILSMPSGLNSDAIVITRAMLASTVSEIFIHDDSVVVELEIGIKDVSAFVNLLPDDLHAELGFDPEPWSERLIRFVREDFVIREGGDQPLFGFLRALELRQRIRRDEITGEPLPTDPDSAETVISARLTYPTSGRPPVLYFSAPGTEAGAPEASVGFMAYHRGVPVNDFRYLGAHERINLDWDDPWYSGFENRNLRRQFYAPISAYLYVEPYEVRKEVVFRPRDLQQWVDLGLEGVDTIRVAQQEDVIQRAVEFLRSRNPVTIDGTPAEGYLDRAHFIYRNLRTSGVFDPPRDLDATTATMGVIFTYPTDGLPEEVAMEWQLFDERIPEVPSSATDEAGSLPYTLRPNDNVLRWQNFLTNPTLPVLVDVTSPPRGRLVFLVLAVAALVGLAVLTGLHARDLIRGARPSRRVALTALSFVIILGVSVPATIRLGVSDDEAKEVLGTLLRNVYLAFDYRDEERIYDTLEKSVAGELLTDVFLETRRSLELENQGGARAKVKEVTILDGRYSPTDGGAGFVSILRWTVRGSVGHWGHIHQRTNQYQARIVVRADDGQWKIVDLEVLEERRL
jgi:hypothetical protein